MAADRERCDLDQTSWRFGACAIDVGSAPSTTCGGAVVEAAAGVVVGEEVEDEVGAGVSWNCRAVVLNAAGVGLDSWRAAVAATPRRRETYMLM